MEPGRPRKRAKTGCTEKTKGHGTRKRARTSFAEIFPCMNERAEWLRGMDLEVRSLLGLVRNDECNIYFTMDKARYVENICDPLQRVTYLKSSHVFFVNALYELICKREGTVPVIPPDRPAIQDARDGTQGLRRIYIIRMLDSYACPDGSCNTRGMSGNNE